MPPKTTAPNCPLCSSGATWTYFSKRNYEYRRCRLCDHVFAHPFPNAQENLRHYRGSYSKEYLEHNRAWFEELAKTRLEIVNGLVPFSSRRLLDVGSGFGFFLRRARDDGWEVQGIEISQKPLEFSRSEFGLQVVAEEVETALPALEGETFDVVCFWHVLEHLERPGPLLTESIRILRKGGVLVLNSPNLNSLIFKLMGRRWSWIYTPGHLQYFSVGPLAEWLRRSGLRIERRETWDHAPNLYFLLEEAVLLSLSDVFFSLGLSGMGSRLARTAHGYTNQFVVQKKLNRFYRKTPRLSRYLLDHDLGHEFLLVARKGDAS